MYLYIQRNGYEERCGRVKAVFATSTSDELYFVSVRFIDGMTHAYQWVERFSLREQ